MKKVDRPCECGHPESQHKQNFYNYYYICLVSDVSNEVHECVFKLDNLAYMEQCYDKNKQVRSKV